MEQSHGRPAPVLCIAFNRPDLLGQVLTAVRDAGPRELYVAIDGPRADRPEDSHLCSEVAEVAAAVDWASDLHLKVEENNLGLGPAVVSAISWALDTVDRVVVLEDDCLPDPSFLHLCDELLERYRDDERVMQISGTNWGASPDRFAGYSYAFTGFGPVWGWATWRRAWALNDYELASWPRFKAAGLTEGIAAEPRFRRVLARDWDKVLADGGTWDYQWQYSVLRNHGLSICPARNLVVNIGHRADGTQLHEPDQVFSNLPLESLEFPLVHPPEVARNPSVDSVYGRLYWQKRGWPGALFRWLVRDPRLNRAIRKAVRGMPRARLGQPSR